MVVQTNGLIKSWVKSVIPSISDVSDIPEGKRPFGTPALKIGAIEDKQAFDSDVFGITQPERVIIKRPGSDDVEIPKGFEHMQELFEAIIKDQKENNPLYHHMYIDFTFRQNISKSSSLANIKVHTDASRIDDSAEEDYIYFAASKQGTIVQAKPVKNPQVTLNRMSPQALIDAGLMRQAEPFEIWKGRKSTYHVQGSDEYEPHRTFVRVIATHPNIDYFKNLPDYEKEQLPPSFCKKHDIYCDSEMALSL